MKSANEALKNEDSDFATERPADFSRRAFLQMSASTVLATCLPFSATTAATTTHRANDAGRWLDIGETRAFKVNQPHRIPLPEGDPVYVVRVDTRKWFALSSRCTHLGCEVQWNTPEHRYICPCHGSQFTSAGTVERGPAKKPLMKLNVRTKGSRVLVEIPKDYAEG